MLRSISRNFSRLSSCCGQIAYVLLTRAPVAGKIVTNLPLPLDLHVLSLSLAFILSQDQTLRCCLYLVLILFFEKSKARTSFIKFVAFTRLASATLSSVKKARSALPPVGQLIRYPQLCPFPFYLACAGKN